MDSSIYLSTASQRTLGRQLEVIANNIANANSVGFKNETVVFASVIADSRPTDVNYPSVGNVTVNNSEGSKIKTGNWLDVAVSGNAWMGVQTPGGLAYTRDGRMTLSPFGDLTNLAGDMVADSAGAPINLGDVRGKEVRVSEDGRIFVGGAFVAELGLFKLEPEDITKRYGNTAFFTDRAPQPAIPGQDATVLQGVLEGSNTNMMQEMTNLITVTRLFEASSTAIEKTDELLRQSARELSQRR